MALAVVRVQSKTSVLTLEPVTAAGYFRSALGCGCMGEGGENLKRHREERWDEFYTHQHSSRVAEADGR